MSSSIVFHFVFFLLHLRIFCVYVCACGCAMVCLEVRVGFSFFHVGAGTLTQVVGLGSNCLYLLSHTGPSPYFSRQDLALDRELTDWLGCLAKEFRGSACSTDIHPSTGFIDVP